MSVPRPLALARVIALATSALLLGGAYLSEYGFGLAPCEICWWQRYPHSVAAALALLAFVVPRAARVLVALAAAAIAISGLIGAYHAGIEWGWWPGFTTCTSTGGATLDAILAAPVVRCDLAQWRLAGISLAGWNCLFSLGAALVIAYLLASTRKDAL